MIHLDASLVKAETSHTAPLQNCFLSIILGGNNFSTANGLVFTISGQ